jgi:uncharacterized repeat protein (TIGR02059 family)
MSLAVFLTVFVPFLIVAVTDSWYLCSELTYLMKNTSYKRLAAVAIAFVVTCAVMAQTTWYNAAQSRIDTLRKGTFSVKMLDKLGNPVSDSVKIILKKHAFTWGYACDLSIPSTAGTTYKGSTTSGITSIYGDQAIYQTERWGKYLCYTLPTVTGKPYNLTLKFAELYFSTSGSRIFDVYLNGELLLKNFDKYQKANGKFVAYDTTFSFTATSDVAKVEFLASKDNVSINGLILAETTGSSTLRLNCAGTTINIKGKLYYADDTYINNASASSLPTDDDWTKAVMLKYCNFGVCGNEFKWSGIEPTKGVLNYAPFEYTYNWYKSVGWDMRAHTLLWGGNNVTDYHCIPQWVMDLRSNPKAMYDTCRMRVIREVTRYKGVVKEYDVLNEPTHANFLQSIVGDSINWNCFKWAHEADPNARLFVNDYNIIEWQDQTNNFVTLVQKMLQNGAPITGIGAQCHIGSSVDLTNFKTRFDQLGQFGLPIKVTEFDMGAKSLTEAQYAVEMARMMRLCFSHPSIEGFVFWGLTEPTWVPASIVNVIREDKTSKIAADTIYNLLHQEWTTNVSGLTDSKGKQVLKGYFGDYDVLAKINGNWEKFTLTFKKGDNGKSFEMVQGNGNTPSPKLKGVQIVGSNQIQLTFDKKMVNPSSNLKNFKVFDKKMNYLTAASLKADDSTRIILTTNASVNDKDYLPVSYAPGTVSSADGGILEAFGPEIDMKVKPTYVSSKTTTDGKKIQITFDNKLVDSTVVYSNYVVRVNNSVDTVTASSIGATKDYLQLTLKEPILKRTDAITVDYLPGALRRTDNLFVTSFAYNAVSNAISVPAVTSSTTTTAGTTIYLIFDQIMSDPTGQEATFSIYSKIGTKLQIAKSDLFPSNTKVIRLTLSNAVIKGDSISVTYKPGTVSASTGIPAETFTTVVANVSTTAVTEASTSALSIYPTPFKEQINLVNVSDFDAVSVLELSGKTVLKQTLNGSATATIPTNTLGSGVYLVVLSQGSTKTCRMVVKN